MGDAGPEDAQPQGQTAPPLLPWSFSVPRTPRPYLSWDEDGQRQQDNG